MTAYYGGNKVKDTGEYGVYLGSKNTNCLTYTPKNVNLELSNGTLTLKAGSKVYVPNGSGVFDEVTLTADKRIADTTKNGKYYLLYSKISNSVTLASVGDSVSGAGAIPTKGLSAGYDTTANIIKRYDGDLSVNPNHALCSLPVAVTTWVSGQACTSIDQVFDWCGYIGSTAFVLPDVKGLIPNGFNADGTYKSIEFETSGVLTYNYTGTGSHDIYLTLSKSTLNVQVRADFVYDKNINFNIYKGSSKTTDMACGNAALSSGRITSLTPYTAQSLTTVIPVNAIYNGSERVYQYLPGATTFNAGSNLATYTVPKGCTKLGIDCVASKGGTFRANGGNGGRVTCDLSVTEGQTLYITVGAIPTDASTPSYNASDIRIGGTDYANRIIVAGGGGDGNNGSNDVALGGHGGAGGGLTGADGSDVSQAGGGNGGTQTAGGAGGGASGYPISGAAGTLGLGGKGGYGGNGGAGYYGGGGAGGSSYYGNWGGGGGGGSSYTSSACSNVVHTQGYQNGAGYIKITPKG